MSSGSIADQSRIDADHLINSRSSNTARAPPMPATSVAHHCPSTAHLDTDRALGNSPRHRRCSSPRRLDGRALEHRRTYRNGISAALGLHPAITKPRGVGHNRPPRSAFGLLASADRFGLGFLGYGVFVAAGRTAMTITWHSRTRLSLKLSASCNQGGRIWKVPWAARLTAQPHHTVTVGVDLDIGQCRYVLARKLGFDLGRDDRSAT